MKKTINSVLVSFLMGVLLVNCGGGGGDPDPTVVNSYSGAGSKWDVTLNSDSTFVITHKENAAPATPVNMTINGTYQSLPSGFVELTVDTATGSYTDKPAHGDKAYGLEVNSYAFYLRPTGSAGSSGEVITMVQSGSCPSGTFSGNWLIARNLHSGVSADPTDLNQDAFGTFTWNSTTNKIDLPAKYSLQAPTAIFPGGVTSTDTLACSNGVATLTPVGATIPESTIFFTSNGGVIVHGEHPQAGGGLDEDIITGFQAETISSKANFDGDYAGLLMFSDITNSDSVQPLSINCNATRGNCTGSTVDVDTGVAPVGATVATVTLSGGVDSPSNGFISGTIAMGGGSGKITCMIDTNAASTSKNIISCSGQDPADNTKLFNILLVSK